MFVIDKRVYHGWSIRNEQNKKMSINVELGVMILSSSISILLLIGA